MYDPLPTSVPDSRCKRAIARRLHMRLSRQGAQISWPRLRGKHRQLAKVDLAIGKLRLDGATRQQTVGQFGFQSEAYSYALGGKRAASCMVSSCELLEKSPFPFFSGGGSLLMPARHRRRQTRVACAGGENFLPGSRRMTYNWPLVVAFPRRFVDRTGHFRGWLVLACYNGDNTGNGLIKAPPLLRQ